MTVLFFTIIVSFEKIIENIDLITKNKIYENNIRARTKHRTIILIF